MELEKIILRPYYHFEFERACEIRKLEELDAKNKFWKQFEKSGSWNGHYLTLAIARNLIKDDGSLQDELVGDMQIRHCEYTMPPGVVEIGCEVAEESRNRGYGTLALKEVVRILFADGYHRISGSTAVTNFAMQKTFEKSGFSQEGIMKKLFLVDGESDEGEDGVDYLSYAITN